MPLPCDSNQIEELLEMLRDFVRRRFRLAEDQVDDLTQEVVLRLLSARNPIEKLENYALRVARNCAIRHLKHQARRAAQVVEFDLSDAGMAANAYDTLQGLERLGPDMLRFVRSLDAVDCLLLEAALEGVSLRKLHRERLAGQVGYNTACMRRHELLAQLRRLSSEGHVDSGPGRRGRSSKRQLRLRDRLLELAAMAEPRCVPAPVPMV